MERDVRERKNKEGREKGMVRCNNRGGGGNFVRGKAGCWTMDRTLLYHCYTLGDGVRGGEKDRERERAEKGKRKRWNICIGVALLSSATEM